ncbi:hypothetical protein [Niveispirillum fermenti]|uniref:hypothetical protein n=1 Tax=Niveispirillum fermenti TaxID=1233113 RepID=UPI003A85D934
MGDTPKTGNAGASGTKMPASAITAELVQQWFTDALRGSVGRGKAFSREDVCDAAQVNPNTLGSWMGERNTPVMWQFMRLAAVLGPDLVNGLLRPIGMGGADWLAPADTGLWSVNADVAGFSQEIAEALADDGRVDPVEQARIDARLNRVVESAQRYLAGRALINRGRLRVVGGGS